jgi:hypothetical protein
MLKWITRKIGMKMRTDLDFVMMVVNLEAI